MIRRFIPVVLLMVAFTLFSGQEADAQIFSTKLKITVIDPLGNVVEDAKVTLFKNKSDYEKEVNEVQKYQMTNSKGQVTFKKLEAASYYVMVTKGDLSNAGGGEIVSDLESGKLNKVNIVISDGL